MAISSMSDYDDYIWRRYPDVLRHQQEMYARQGMAQQQANSGIVQAPISNSAVKDKSAVEQVTRERTLLLLEDV